MVVSEGSLCTFEKASSVSGACDGGKVAGWQPGRMRGQEAGGKKKAGERKKTKPYTTIPSKGFALSKLPLDRPHQGAVMLMHYARIGRLRREL